MDPSEDQKYGILHAPAGISIDAWAYELSIDQLLEQLSIRQLKTEGTAAQLRGRLTRYERAGRRRDEGEPPLPSPTVEALPRDILEMSDNRKDNYAEIEENGAVGGLPRDESLRSGNLGAIPRRAFVPRPPPPVVETPPRESCYLSAADAYEKMRRWNLNFSGERGADAETFLRRIEEARGIAPISDDSLFRCLPFLLTGIALHWLRVEQGEWRTWAEFCRAFRAHFGDPDYQDVVREEISRRTQGEHEPVAEFVTCVRVLLNRLEPPWNLSEQLTRVHKNMLPKLQLAVHRDDFDDFATLVRLATRVQRSYVAASRYRAPPPPEQSAFPDLSYKPSPCTTRSSMTMTVNDRTESGRRGEKARDEPRVRPTERSGPRVDARQGRGETVPPNRNTASRRVPESPATGETTRTATRAQCWNCGRGGHFARECKEAPRIHCYRCGKQQHTVRTCPSCAGNGRGSS